MKFRGHFLAISAISLSLASAPRARAENVAVDGSDNVFPTTIEEKIAGKTVKLKLTGVALREKFFVNVYALGSYVGEDASPRSASELAASDAPKVLHLILERDVGGDEIAEALNDGISYNYPKSAFAAERKKLMGYLSTDSVPEGAHFRFYNIPGKGLQCKLDGKEALLIENPKFSKAIWEIYLGKNNLGSGIRDGLISRL